MKKTIVYSLLALLGTSFFINVNAQDNNHVTQEIGRGVIDWTDKVIKVTGSGASPADKPAGQARLLAEKAAISDAYRQMAEIVYGVRVDSETIVKDFVVQSDVIKTSVDGFIKGARRGEKRISADGNVEYDLFLPMYGKNALSDAIDLDKHIRKNQKMGMKKFHNESLISLFNKNKKNKIALNNNFFMVANSPDNKNSNCLECHIPHPITDAMKKKTENNNVTAPIINQNSNGIVTGVIIDAKGLGLTPAMDPAVFDTQEKKVYIGNWEIDADFVVNNGVIGYFTDLEDARKDVSRIGTNPIIIKANSVKNVTDIILEAESANNLTSTDNTSKFLQKYAVDVIM